MFNVLTATATSRRISFSDKPYGEHGVAYSWSYVEAVTRSNDYSDPSREDLEAKLEKVNARIAEIESTPDLTYTDAQAEEVTDLYAEQAEIEERLELSDEIVYPLDNDSFEDEVLERTSGPQMNYFWPLSDRVPGSSELREWAVKIVDLPLCLVILYDEDGEPDEIGLALTGGGMYLGDRIATGYARLGFAVPETLATDSNLADSTLEPVVYEAIEATREFYEYRLALLVRTLESRKEVI